MASSAALEAHTVPRRSRRACPPRDGPGTQAWTQAGEPAAAVPRRWRPVPRRAIVDLFGSLEVVQRCRRASNRIASCRTAAEDRSQRPSSDREFRSLPRRQIAVGLPAALPAVSAPGRPFPPRSDRFCTSEDPTEPGSIGDPHDLRTGLIRAQVRTLIDEGAEPYLLENAEQATDDQPAMADAITILITAVVPGTGKLEHIFFRIAPGAPGAQRQAEP